MWPIFVVMSVWFSRFVGVWMDWERVVVHDVDDAFLLFMVFFKQVVHV